MRISCCATAAITAFLVSCSFLSAHAESSTLSITPDSGYSLFGCLWTDTVTLSDPSSTWTSAGLSFRKLGSLLALPGYVCDIDADSGRYHGGTLVATIPPTVPEGLWVARQANIGNSPDGSQWIDIQEQLVLVYPGDTPNPTLGQ